MSTDQVEPRAVASGIPVYCAFDELADITSLVPNPGNPNRHPERQIELLAKIIKAQGWRVPITVSDRSGFVVRGHGRLLAAQKLGVKEVPVDRQDYASDADEWADLVADNRLSELAEMDKGALVDLLQEIDAAPLDLELAGVTEEDYETLAAQASQADTAESEDEGLPFSSEGDTKEDAAEDELVQCPWCGYEFEPGQV
ncbi:MAG: ParB N-terminal domain-containing protein [Firmicutes bacterium]|nr:ParB N-terminal domain-containing protein [Bacillota bacterium]